VSSQEECEKPVPPAYTADIAHTLPQAQHTRPSRPGSKSHSARQLSPRRHRTQATSTTIRQLRHRDIFHRPKPSKRNAAVKRATKPAQYALHIDQSTTERCLPCAPLARSLWTGPSRRRPPASRVQCRTVLPLPIPYTMPAILRRCFRRPSSLAYLEALLATITCASEPQQLPPPYSRPAGVADYRPFTSISAVALRISPRSLVGLLAAAYVFSRGFARAIGFQSRSVHIHWVRNAVTAWTSAPRTQTPLVARPACTDIEYPSRLTESQAMVRFSMAGRRVREWHHVHSRLSLWPTESVSQTTWIGQSPDRPGHATPIRPLIPKCPRRAAPWRRWRLLGVLTSISRHRNR